MSEDEDRQCNDTLLLGGKAVAVPANLLEMKSEEKRLSRD
jgi:hypothetical protein